jgi:hypothetical protein
MIVKNESKIIKRMFDSVINVIDTYCICDTGSTDNTVEIITNYFKEKNIDGKIVHEEFKNFCYNRNFALDSANGMSDYILLLDADMILEIGDFNKCNLITFDEYNILQGSEYYHYYNKRIIKNNGLYKYYGVTHEYITCSKPASTLNLNKDVLFINDIGDGGSKQNKFLRDIELLKQGIIDEPNNSRYYFYLGNSYFDSNQNVDAINSYKQLININEAWTQEKYIACIRIYEAYHRTGQEELGVHYLILSTKFDKDRIEGIYRLVKYYCIIGLPNIAYNFYSLIQEFFENLFYTNTCIIKLSNNLFCLQVEYKYFLPYYMIIVSERIKKHDIGIKMYEIIFFNKYIDAGEWWSNNLIFNLQFFIDKVDKNTNLNFFKNCETYINLLKGKYNLSYPDLLERYNKYFDKKHILKLSDEFINTNNIFIYWTGKEYSLIKLLRKLIYLHSINETKYKVHFITISNLLEYIENIPLCFYSLHPAHQADFIRVNVIYNYGGIWLDSDTLVMDDLSSLFDTLKENKGFFIKQNNETLCNGIFGSIANTDLMKDWKDYINEVLKNNNKINWEDIGNKYLNDKYINNPDLFENYKLFNGLDNMYPVNFYSCLSEYIEKPYDNYINIVKEYQPLLILVNSVYHKLHNLSEEEILKNNIPLSYFLRKSISDYIDNTDNPVNDEIIKLHELFKNIIYDNSTIFTNIYKNQIWNQGDSNVPLSGPGSSIESTKDITNFLNNFIDEYNVTSILDLGCGDLVWMSNTPFFNDNNINYTGIDVVDFLIDEHKIKYNNKNFYVKDIVNPSLSIEFSDIIIIRDVLFHLKNNDILNIFKNIKNKFKFIAITSCNNSENTDLFNKYYFTQKNIHIPPFNISNKFLKNCNEPTFGRQFYIYSHDDFFPNLSPITINNQVNDINDQINDVVIVNKYIILADWLLTFIDMTVYTLCQNLEKHEWKIILLSQIDIEKLKSEKCIILCVTLNGFDISQLKCDNVKLLYFLCDLHPYDQIKDKCIDNTDIIIGCFTYLFPQWKDTFKSIMDKPAYWLQGCSIKNYFDNINFNENPKKKIFVSGYNNDTYPFRNYMFNLSIENDNIETLNHPSYSNNRAHNIVHQPYYEKLNEYLCCFTDALSWNYIVSKVFEITAVGSLLLVQDSIEEQLNKLEYFDGINCIMCNQDNVSSKIEWILDEKNREEVDNIRMEGMILTREKHNSEVKAKLFNDYVATL